MHTMKRFNSTTFISFTMLILIVLSPSLLLGCHCFPPTPQNNLPALSAKTITTRTTTTLPSTTLDLNLHAREINVWSRRTSHVPTARTGWNPTTLRAAFRGRQPWRDVPLYVRGGGGALGTAPPSSPISTTSTSLGSTSNSKSNEVTTNNSNVNAGTSGAAVVAGVAGIESASADSLNNGDSTRRKYMRVAKELARQVWPRLPKLPAKHRDKSGGIAGISGVPKQKQHQQSFNSHHQVDELSRQEDYHRYETKILKERQHAISMRRRVVFSLLLMLGGKGVTIATPFLFKALVDLLPHYVDVMKIGGGGLSSVTASTISSSGVPFPSILPLLSKTPISIPVIFLLAYGLSRTLASLLKESTNAIFAHVAQSAIRSFGRSTFDHVHALDLAFHLNKNTGTLSRILERGSRSISFVLNAMVFNTLPTLVEVGVVSWCMLQKFGVSHSFTVLFTILAYSIFTIAVTRWRSSIRKDMNSLENIASGKVSDSLLNYETVKYFNNELHEGTVYENTLHKYQDMALKAQGSLAFLNFGQNAIFSTGLTLIMYLTIRDLMRGRATVGDLVLVNGLLFQLSVPLNFIGWVYQEVRQAFIDMEAMFSLRDTEPAVVDSPIAVDYDPAKDGTLIEFDNVEFAYSSSSTAAKVSSSIIPSNSTTSSNPIHEEQIPSVRPILKKTTFSIPQGKTVAIVGSSGSGKSTTLRMIYRFYNPNNGSIRIGGKDISSYTIDSIRRAIAVVPQDVVLFNDSIGYNIHYGNLDAPWEEVVEAAKKAHLHEIIQKLPDGYNTIVGERGLKMSGGEKQRVSLARAILKKSPILLCDEPTSSLDPQTELSIMNNLKEVGRDMTCVIIAHRLSTIQDCDEIVVMDEGRVVESGSHDELIKNGGQYSKLLSFQRTHDSSGDGGKEKKETATEKEVELGIK